MNKYEIPAIGIRNKDVRIKFDPAILRQVAPFIAKADIRHYLTGVFIERAADRGKGLYIAATNGHCLAVVYEPDGEMVDPAGKGVILRAPGAFLTAAKARVRTGLTRRVIVAGNRVSLAPDFGWEHTDAETYIMPGSPWIDGAFPNWKKVLPVFEDLKMGMLSSINMRYMVEFSKVTPGHGFLSTTLWHTRKDGPVVVQIPELPNFIGIVMPMRAASDQALLAAMKPTFDCRPKEVEPSPTEVQPCASPAAPEAAAEVPLDPNVITEVRAAHVAAGYQPGLGLSISLTQRTLRVGYHAAAKIVETIHAMDKAANK